MGGVLLRADVGRVQDVGGCLVSEFLDRGTGASMRPCSRCGVVKPIDRFVKDARCVGGRARRCLECAAAYRRLFLQRNPAYRVQQGKIVERLRRTGRYDQAKLRHRMANRASARLAAAVWRAANRERARESSARWARNNRGSVRAAWTRYAARKRGALSTLTASQWRHIREIYADRCVYCGLRPPRLEMDHIEPLSRHGHHVEDNVVPACRSCNARKHARSLLVFMVAKRQESA